METPLFLVIVTTVAAGSAAGVAGVCVNDYIIAFTIHGITTQGFVASEVITALGTVGSGQTVGLTVRRRHSQLKVRLPKLA